MCTRRLKACSWLPVGGGREHFLAAPILIPRVADSASVNAFFDAMDVVAFTRQLVDIESITGNEGPVGDFLSKNFADLATKCSERLRKASAPMFLPLRRSSRIRQSSFPPTWTLSPFIPSSEDEQRVYGRGSCDAKGIIAAQIAAAERLKQEGSTSDCCSWSAKSATAWARRSRIEQANAASF